jgi:KaiC/GvpD/RAD55 family RecA-like ATPase
MSKKPVKIDGKLALERATAYVLLSTPKKAETVIPLLDFRMFAEVSTWKFLTAGLDLYRRGVYSRNTLCAAVESMGVERAHEHYNLLASSFTSSSTFESHYPLWLDQGRKLFIESSEDEIRETELTSDELISNRKLVLERARCLGEVDQGASMGECVNKAINIMENLRSSGGAGIIPTGFGILDRYMLGLMPGTLTVIGARPSRGKTSLGCQLAIQAQSQDCSVLFVSAEMPAEKVALKLAGMHSKFNTSQFSAPHLLSEADFLAAKKAVNSASGLNIKILHKTDVAAVEAAVLSMDPAPALVVFDYLQILQTPKRYEGMRADYLSEVVRLFTRLADKTGSAFLLLSQVGRSGERGGASNADLKGSGGIEEAADAIILIEKDDSAEGGADSLRRVLRLSKNRYGWGDDIECPTLFDPRTQTFSDWDLVRAQRIAKMLGL